jgi:DNA repair exonuclease SbcCD ATPase subunit
MTATSNALSSFSEQPSSWECADECDECGSLKQQLLLLEDRLRKVAQLDADSVLQKVHSESEIDMSTTAGVSDEEVSSNSSRSSGNTPKVRSPSVDADGHHESTNPASVCEAAACPLQDAGLDVLLDRVEARAQRAEAKAASKQRECKRLAAEVKVLRGQLGGQEVCGASAEAQAEVRAETANAVGADKLRTCDQQAAKIQDLSTKLEAAYARIRVVEAAAAQDWALSDAQLQETLSKLASLAAVEENREKEAKELEQKREKEAEALRFQYEANTALFKHWEAEQAKREMLEDQVETLKKKLDATTSKADFELQQAISRVEAKVQIQAQMEETVDQLEASLVTLSHAATAHLDPMRRPNLEEHWRTHAPVSRMWRFATLRARPFSQASGSAGPTPRSVLRHLGSALEAQTAQSVCSEADE